MLPVLVLAMLVALAVPGLATKPVDGPRANPVAVAHANSHSAVHESPVAHNGDGGNEALTVNNVDLLGVTSVPYGFDVGGTPVGGLSGVAYDPINDVYYVVSDDKSEEAPARYYTVSIGLDPVEVEFEDVTFVRGHGGLFPEGAIDLEGIEWFSKNKLFVSNERDAHNVPSVLRLNGNARVDRSLRLPSYYLPGYTGDTQVSGVHTNLAFESLALTPDHQYLYTATEAALAQDGAPSTTTSGSLSRVLEFGVPGFQPAREFVYKVGPIPETSDEAWPGDNGLSDMVAIDNAGTFLMMERSYVPGFGNTVKLYESSTVGATDVSGWSALAGSFAPMSKSLVVNLADLGLEPGVTLDNMEGMTFGPMLDDDTYSLVLVSDDNFHSFQNTLFIVLAISIGPAD